MHPLLKTILEQALLYTGPATLSRRTHRGRSLVLAYHNVVPDGEPVIGDESLHVPQHRFAEQLDTLAEAAVQVVSLDELLDTEVEPEPDDRMRRVAITFDDAYRGAVQTGVEELARRGLPATIFVAPGLVGGHTFWWDALSATGAGLSRRARETALDEGRGRNEEVMAWARRQGLPVGTVPEHARSASETELAHAARRSGIMMGSHTWSHPNLTKMSGEECRKELALATAWLRKRFDRAPRWLSYPYGLHDALSERQAAAAGHEGAFRIEGGWLPRPFGHLDAFRLPRVNVPAGLSRAGFALRLSGLLCG